MIKKYLNHLIKTAEKNYLNNIYNNLVTENLNINDFVDIGCYTGDNTLNISSACNAKNVFGIDFNQQALDIAHKKGIKTINQNINDKSWNNIESDKFDFVYSNQVIEHLYSVDNYILNIRRILKKNGYALISTENLAGWHNCISLLLGYQPFSTTNICTKKWSIGNIFSIVDDLENKHDPLMVHRAVFTNYSLKEFLKLYDFEIVKNITAGYYPLPNNKLGNFFAKIDKRHAVYIAYLVRIKK